MKSLKIFALTALSLSLSIATIAQKSTTEAFQVSGNCGMCKAKIEKAALEAGATYASWDVDTKQITVKYSSKSTNTAKIQEKIAAVGYDNVGKKASDESYNKLHGCCKYERTSGTTAKTAKASCCDDEECKHDGDHKAECCKEGKCTMAGHNAKDCCKDGKCTMEGHNGKDCCKKAD